MPSTPRERTFRFETAVATMVGALALLVSAYTAYIQRQQVRAQVWPALEYWTGNLPSLNVSLGNKGVGPALVKHVKVTVDGKPVEKWHDALELLLGPGLHGYSQDTIGARVFAAGETKQVLSLLDAATGKPLRGTDAGDGRKFDQARFKIGIEVCYCSTLGDCWTLIQAPGDVQRTEETRRCPQRSAATFAQ